MPQVSHRRSLLDFFSITSNAEDAAQSNLLVADPSPWQQRPRSEGGLPSGGYQETTQREFADTFNPTKRLSLLKLRNFSESHLATRMLEGSKPQDVPPLPAVPAIVRTAPTIDVGVVAPPPPHQEQLAVEERKPRTSLFKRSISKSSSPAKLDMRRSFDERRAGVEKRSFPGRWRMKQSKSSGLEDLARLATLRAQEQQPPPTYGETNSTTLALPVPDPRFSDSSRSEGSNASSDHIYGSTTTTTHTVSTHTTFFRLARKDKNRNSLFPLPTRTPPPEEGNGQSQESQTPRPSLSALSSRSVQAPSRDTPKTVFRRHTDTRPGKRRESQPPLPQNFLANQSITFANSNLHLPGNDSQRSRASSSSSPLRPPLSFSNRERASTGSSFGRDSHDLGTPPPLSTGSGRNSTSTTGRSSLGGLLTLSRFRQSSEPYSPRYGSPGTYSKSNSFAISREALVVPEREEGDTPGKYLERLENSVARSMIAGILSKSSDPFAQAVLRSYTRRFAFFGEPIDMSLRKFLLEADLPKETQQVDRVIQAFADRYHECNPGIFIAPDQAYIIAFSLMMLHTDAFNKNNKRKMQKQDYIKNTSGQQVSEEILGCFYDNICYTPFVHYEEEVDINGERVLPFQTKKTKPKTGSTDSAKKPSGPVDPYNLLVEQKLDSLRPSIKDFVSMSDPYNYRAPQIELDPQYLQRAFTHTGVLQIISARSRPTAYEGNLTNVPDPNNTQAGIIDLKITKVGILWRKAAKKRKARSPWQEWGAILTGSQLYLFKNAHWAKGLMHQFREQQKPAHPRVPVVFKPPLQDFKPDALVKTDDAVALIDSTYTRHKNAFLFVRPGGQEEVFLAENENELHDWLALINYAAAFRTAGVRIRGMVSGAEDYWGQEEGGASDPSNVASVRSVKKIQTAHGEMSIENKGISPQLQRQIMAARRQIMLQKINEIGNEIAETSKNLESMLRSARHLLVLAPITPRAREEVILAAARADTTMKWTRRDIWRMKCHRDILIMDVQQDEISATDVPSLTQQPTEAITETAKKSRPKGLARFGSKTSTVKNQPISPQSAEFASRMSPSSTAPVIDRVSLADSADAQSAHDVFRTPPESAAPVQSSDFGMPPLQLDGQDSTLHRGSITSTLVSVSSLGQGSLSNVTSVSSANRLGSLDQRSGSISRDHRASEAGVDERTLERTAQTPKVADPVESVRHDSIDGYGATPLNLTPETKHRPSVRRSLQKTLREAQHSSLSQRHRRGKDSESTIRTVVPEVGQDEVVSDTPGLKREKGRFILHGKQASVVEFGSEWQSERMQARRRQWRDTTSTPERTIKNTAAEAGYMPNPEASTDEDFVDEDTTPHNNRGFASVTNITSPVILREVHQHQLHGEPINDDSDGTSTFSEHSPGFREDAEAADAYASTMGYYAEPHSYFDSREQLAPGESAPHTDPDRDPLRSKDGTVIDYPLQHQNVDSRPTTARLGSTSLGIPKLPGLERSHSTPATLTLANDSWQQQSYTPTRGPSIRLVNTRGSMSSSSEVLNATVGRSGDEDGSEHGEGVRAMGDDFELRRLSSVGILVQ